MANSAKTVMVFGVFDILHEGHAYFLLEAKKLGSSLVAVLPPDEAVRHLKGRPPANPLALRMSNLEKSGLVDRVLTGDDSPHSWEVFQRVKPEVLALGYDQHELARALSSNFEKTGKSISIVFIGPHEKGALHSSNLRSQK